MVFHVKKNTSQTDQFMDFYNSAVRTGGDSANGGGSTANVDSGSSAVSKRNGGSVGDSANGGGSTAKKRSVGSGSAASKRSGGGDSAASKRSDGSVGDSANGGGSSFLV